MVGAWRALAYKALGLGLGEAAAQLQSPQIRIMSLDMGGCQNYGPFLVPYYNTAHSI